MGRDSFKCCSGHGLRISNIMLERKVLHLELCKSIGDAYCQLNIEGHPFELGQKFIQKSY